MEANTAPTPKPLSTKALSPRQPMIATALNEHVSGYIRWCTPSILEHQHPVNNIYTTDISISAAAITIRRD